MLLNGHKKRAKAGDVTRSLDDGDHIARILAPFYEQLAELAYQDADDEVGIESAFNLENPYIQTILDKLAKDVRGVAETTRDEIRALVGRQAEEGWSIDELADQIREAGVTRSEARATAIARTETAKGYTQGSIAAWQTSGVVAGARWLLGPDSCDVCQAFGDTAVELGGEFADGITGPPAHTNCTCALSPILE
jgi:hypothetical protein